MAGEKPTVTNEDLAEIVRALLPLLPPNVLPVQRCAVEPGDVIVFEAVAHLPEAAIARIRADANAIWPNNRIVVVDQGLKLKVLREKDTRPPVAVLDAASMIRQAIRVAAQDGREDGIEEILERLVEQAKEDA